MTGARTGDRGHSRPRIGLALGGGGARGWAHIGVLEVLTAEGLAPDIVCGCSMGSLVGAGYVTGSLPQLTEWAVSLTWREILGLLDPGLSGGGLIRGERLLRFLREHYADIDIAESPIPFGVNATDLANGREVWLRSGRLFDAVRASIAVPGVFGAVCVDGRWLADGGLVNPVPVSLCRAMGADFVIAVNLNTEPPRLSPPVRGGNSQHDWSGWLRGVFGGDSQNGGAPEGGATMDTEPEGPGQPSLIGSVSAALFIMQDYITRSHLAGEPAHIMLAPRLGRIGVHEFDRAAEAIDEGRRYAANLMPVLREALETAGYEAA